jgi:FecR protein
MPRTMPRRLTPLRLTGFAIGALALLGTPSLALADKVGTAAAVQPDAFTNGTEMKIGNSIFFNQRINTTGKGLVQVLLVDGSTFTVGPGSDLVINKFVYDPAKNTGQVVATLGKGVLRFVGGKISKNDGGVTVNTPTGALAIRGGMFQGKVDGHGSLFSFLFGVEMKFTGPGGDVHRVYQPGYTLDFTGGVPTVRPTLPADTAFFMKALSGGGQVVVGGNHIDNKEGPAQAVHNTVKVNVSEITQDGSADVVQTNLQNQQNQPNPPPPQTPPPPPPQAGYAAGVDTQTTDGGTDQHPVGILSSNSPQDVGISFNADQSTLSASFNLHVVRESGGGGALINFGSTGDPNSLSADTTAITVLNGDAASGKNRLNYGTGQLVVSSAAFCAQCDFLKWGKWTGHFNFQDTGTIDGRTTTHTKDVQVNGYWVAGDVVNDTVGALPISGTASYAGNAIGTVANGLNGAIVTYVATGNMGMSWSFGTRTGQLDITHFDTSVAPDGLHFQGAMSMPGVVNGQIVATNLPNQFTGGLSGIGTPSNIGVLSGNANGSFVGATQLLTSLPGNPQGVIGNWNIGNGNSDNHFTYGATGIFAGKVH